MVKERKREREGGVCVSNICPCVVCGCVYYIWHRQQRNGSVDVSLQTLGTRFCYGDARIRYSMKSLRW